MKEPDNLNALFARALVDELCAAGAREAVISPGSRSTPLVLACAEEKRMKLRKIFDGKYGIPFDEELIVLVGKDEFLKKNAHCSFDSCQWSNSLRAPPSRVFEDLDPKRPLLARRRERHPEPPGSHCGGIGRSTRR